MEFSGATPRLAGAWTVGAAEPNEPRPGDCSVKARAKSKHRGKRSLGFLASATARTGSRFASLHNLEHGHLETAVGSAFVAAEGPIWVWLPVLVCLLALAELLWHSGRLIVTFTLGHIGATLIVAVELTAAIQFGWLPVSVAHASDVGISYGAAAVLGALTAAIPPRCRPAWIGWWLAIGLLVVWLGDHFTNTGHFVALTLGMLLSVRFRSVVRWTRVRFALLAVGGAQVQRLSANENAKTLLNAVGDAVQRG